MIQLHLEQIEKKHLKKELPVFQVGDVVDVHIRLKEGEKERIQIFTGTVIAKKGGGIRESFTVRRIVAGEGVERVFPIHTPSISTVTVRRPGRTRRAKLYYLRDRVGKSTKTKERREDEMVPGSEGTEGAAMPEGAEKAEKPKKKGKSGKSEKTEAAAAK
jgi:large subunit ribosomal protein L19